MTVSDSGATNDGSVQTRLCAFAREAHARGDFDAATVALRSLVGKGMTPHGATQAGRYLCFLRSEHLAGRFNDGGPQIPPPPSTPEVPRV